MIATNGMVYLLNLFITTNSGVQLKLKNLANKVIGLHFGNIKFELLITDNGDVKTTNLAHDCTIYFPLAIISHLIHKDAIRTLRTIKITGNNKLAIEFLDIITKLNPTNFLYTNNSQLLNLGGFYTEKLVKSFVDYANLVVNNFTTSGSRYIQYEKNFITDKYQITEFCNQVDEIKDRYQLLLKRVQKLAHL